MTWILHIPGWQPVLANQLMGHWAAAARLKRRDVQQVARAKIVHGVPDAKGKRIVRIEIARSVGGRWPDVDAPLKSTLDALVQCRLLVDDSAKWCEWERPTFVRGPKATTITIEEAS